MIVLNENQLNKLNILTAQNNSTAKEVLKEADVKTLLSQNKNLNLSTILNSLFKSVGNTNQSNQTVLNLLKNTNVAKNLGSFPANLQQLLKSLPNNESTKDIKAFLQNFLVNIDKSSNTNVKEQLVKSGLFLESKLSQQINTPTQKNESSILNDMKTVLLKTKAQLETQIPTQTKTLNTTTQVSKENININETLKFVDKLLSQLSKSENVAPSDIKNVLNQIKTDIQNQNTITNKNETLNQLDKLITKLPVNTTQNSSNVQQTQATPTLLKENPSLLNEIKTTLTKVQTLLQNQIQQAQNSQVPKENIQNANETLKQIDKILTQINKAEPLLSTQVKDVLSNSKTQIENLTTLISKAQTQANQTQNTQMQSSTSQLFALKAQLQNTTSQTTNINEVVKQIDKVLTQINNLEQKPTINQINTPILKADSPILNETKTLLNKIQTQFSLVAKESTSINETVKQIDNILGKMNKNEAINISDIKNLITKIKAEVQNQPSLVNKIETSTQIDKLLEKINVEIKTAVQQQTASLSQTPILKVETPVFNEIKTLLTKIQTQLQAQLQNQFQNQTIDEVRAQIQTVKDSDPSESLKQIDKLLNQIDYHQLYSLANNSNNVYVPFLWDLLEDGSIDIKKAEEDKFYCIIDLSLKELGNLDIHLFMFEQENLDISIYVEKDETKQLIRQKLSNLKQAMFSSDIKLQGISIYSKKSEEEINEEDKYKQDDNFDFGLNIKV